MRLLKSVIAVTPHSLWPSDFRQYLQCTVCFKEPTGVTVRSESPALPRPSVVTVCSLDSSLLLHFFFIETVLLLHQVAVVMLQLK